MARHDTRILEPGKIVETIELLQQRISERFPDSGLARVAADLVRVGGENEATVVHIRRGDARVRAGVAVAFIAGIAVVGTVLASVAREDWWHVKDGPTFIGVVEASLGTIVFLGAAVVYLLSLERRFRRERALRKIHELRSIAHVVDMHQLRKDPDRVRGGGPMTASSPKLDMTAFEVSRYLDYCSEMLALISKIGALYLQGYEDPIAVSAVDELETLTTGLSRKIWQKIMILDRLTAEER